MSASDYYQDGSYYGGAFSIQLNAYVVVFQDRANPANMGRKIQPPTLTL